MSDPRIEAVAKVFAWAWWKEKPEECHMDLAKEALAAADAAAWQPIETALRDGTRYLSEIDGDMHVIKWGKASHVPLYGWISLMGDPEDADLLNPTHWRPLPAGRNREGR